MNVHGNPDDEALREAWHEHWATESDSYPQELDISCPVCQQSDEGLVAHWLKWGARRQKRVLVFECPGCMYRIEGERSLSSIALLEANLPITWSLC